MERLLLLLVLFVGACSSETAPLTIGDVVVKRPMPGMHMSAGYFTLTNHTSQSIVITAVTSPQFGAVEMHESVVEDGVARMLELGELTLAPNSTIEFRPGGKHLMLMQPADELDTVVLDFYAGGDVILSINVQASD